MVSQGENRKNRNMSSNDYKVVTRSKCAMTIGGRIDGSVQQRLQSSCTVRYAQANVEKSTAAMCCEVEQ